MFKWNKYCHWSHDWTKWGDSYEVSIRQLELGNGIIHRQKKVCQKCNKIKVRDIF